MWWCQYRPVEDAPMSFFNMSVHDTDDEAKRDAERSAAEMHEDGFVWYRSPDGPWIYSRPPSLNGDECGVYRIIAG